MGKVGYAGIDWGRFGQSNRDVKTGIHYGVIPQYAVLQAWSDESEPFYIDCCPNCGNDLSDEDEEFIEENEYCPHCKRDLSMDDVHEFQEPVSFFYEKDGYACEQQVDDPDIFIMKSPYFTYAQHCSPCAPGAGYILNWTDPGVGIKAYCFGHDWFDSEKTGKLVPCERCGGTGIIKKNKIPNYNEDVFVENGGIVINEGYVYCWVCSGRGLVDEYIKKAPYPVYSVETKQLVGPTKE